MVLLATPNAALSRSAVTHGSLAGSDRKLTWPSAYTTPAAHVARRPACSGEGRLRASFATARRARSAYSSSSTDRHTESVMPTISSTTGRSPVGTFSSSRAITATPALLGHPGRSWRHHSPPVSSQPPTAPTSPPTSRPAPAPPHPAPPRL